MATATMGSTATRPAVIHEKLSGWTLFSGVTLLIVGGLNLVNGFTSIQHAGYYTSHVVYSNMTTWGWIFLFWGAMQLIAGAATLAHHDWGRYLGIFLAGTASILWFFMIFAAPFAALIGVTVSILVLLGLTAAPQSDEY
jgi:uncharacterized membrane protein HdeD (DUF308 family)